MTVYFIGGDFDRVKIGYTGRDAEGRLRDLQTGSPVTLRILASAPGEHDDERSLHLALAEERTHREWFTISDRLGLLIASVAETGQLGDWRKVLSEPAAARAYADKFGTVRGFSELGALPDDFVRLRLDNAGKLSRPEEIRWDRLVRTWAEAVGDSDDDHVDHYIREGYGSCCQSAFIEIGSQIVEWRGRAAIRTTADYIAEVAGDPSAELAVWVQAVAFTMTHDDRGFRETARRVPSLEQLSREAARVFRCSWHNQSTLTLPVQMELPESCILDAHEFVKQLAMYRALIWSQWRVCRVWLERYYESWPRQERAA